MTATDRNVAVFCEILSAIARDNDPAAKLAAVDWLAENGYEKWLVGSLAQRIRADGLTLEGSGLDVLGFVITRAQADAIMPWRCARSAAKAIKAALKRRSGKEWSVRQARGPDYMGWLVITTARRDGWYGTQCNMNTTECRELQELLGKTYVLDDGVWVGPGRENYRKWIDRAEGRTREEHC